MPGLVALVGHQDDVHVETLGTMSVGHPSPMKRDTIFRIASITKPIAAVAAMILVEECKLRLDESIEAWLPELANRRVLLDRKSCSVRSPVGASEWRWTFSVTKSATPQAVSVGLAGSERPHTPIPQRG